MDLGALGSPAQLWRRWVLISAGHAARGTTGMEIRRHDGAGRLESGEAWLRLRRMAGNRAVLWGGHPDLHADPAFLEDLRDAAPDWSYDVDSFYAARDVGFLGWYAHGSWSSVPSPVPAEVAELLAPVSSDAAVQAWWHEAWPTAEPEVLSAVLAEPCPASLGAVVGKAPGARAQRQVGLGEVWSTRQLSDAATTHLRTQIHAQMRGARELADRGLPARPQLLRQWAKVNATGVPFRHAVGALCPADSSGVGFQHGADGTGLDEAQQRSLDNVLVELRMAETDEKNGAWLFARVAGDGRQLTLERRYDSWPSWYLSPDAGPTMSALHAEMRQRTPDWRPGWASLIPAERY